MKKISNLLFALLACVIVFACEETATDLTQKISKIETSFYESGEKNENYFEGLKEESLAENELIDEIKKNVDRVYQENIQNMKKRYKISRTLYHGYDVGVIPTNNTCPAWSEYIRIFMDCEDKNPQTRIEDGGWKGAWSVDGNKNLSMVFCRVDGRLFNKVYDPPSSLYTWRYDLLKLGYQNLPGTMLVARHFDNEDKNNTNSHQGDISPNIRNNNTTLYFHFFPEEYPNEELGYFPDLGFSYGLIACDCGNLGGATVYVDDEDNNNANYLLVNGSPVSFNNAYPIIGGKNTTIYLGKVH